MKENMWRIRISVLQIADVIALAAAFVLATFEPGYLDGILSGNLEEMEITAGVMLLASFFWLVQVPKHLGLCPQKEPVPVPRRSGDDHRFD